MDAEKITKEIALLERKMHEADNQTLKDALSKKITRLKNDLDGSNDSATQLASKLLRAKAKVKLLTRSDFDELIRRLARKPEYRFLRSMTKQEIKDDLERPAKPVGWRFKGRGDYRTPTKAQVREGKKNGTVYYENRRMRSDVSKVAQLGTGGTADSAADNNEPILGGTMGSSIEKAAKGMNVSGPRMYFLSEAAKIEFDKVKSKRTKYVTFLKWLEEDDSFDPIEPMTDTYLLEKFTQEEIGKLVRNGTLSVLHKVDTKQDSNEEDSIQIIASPTDDFKAPDVHPYNNSYYSVVSDITEKWDTVELIQRDLENFLKSVADAGGKDLLDETVKAINKAVSNSREFV